jgi:hypothetical protein
MDRYGRVTDIAVEGQIHLSVSGGNIDVSFGDRIPAA